jgi:4-amino-4-deoxy-L-arabinose transferase-like glycosyltransferase
VKSTPNPRWTYCGLSVLLAALWLATLSLRPLFNTDEGRYAEIPREMLSGGDWVIPHLNGLAYIEKPPLQYWATALSLAIVGQNELAARLYTALCALAAVSAVWLTAKRLWGEDSAWRSAAMLSSMLLFLAMGQLLTLDMSLTFYMTVALAAFLCAQTAAAAAADRQALHWMLLCWTATALGVLTKGLVAAAIPAAVLVLYSLISRDFGPWRRLRPLAGLPFFLAITAPWFYLAARRLADFLQFFFIREHFARYLTPMADREAPWWFFGVVFLLGSAPWTLPALRVLMTGWRRPRAGAPFDPALFLRLWILFVCIFFSLSSSKLIPYILPAMPALALLTATLPADALKRDLQRTALLTLGAAALLGGVCLYAPGHVAPSVRSPYFLSLAAPLAQIALLLAASGLYVLSQRHRDITRSAVFLGIGWALSGLLLVRAAAVVAPVYSGIVLAHALPEAAHGVSIYSVGTYDQTLPFYWRRTVELVAYRGELDYGLGREPGAELTTVDAFLDRWTASTDAFAVMETKMFDELKSRAVPMRELARDANRVLVARR